MRVPGLPKGGPGFLWSRQERVLPAQTGKSREITIRRTQNKAVLDGKRRQMRVGNKVRVYPGQIEKGAENILVPVGRRRRPDHLAGEP